MPKKYGKSMPKGSQNETKMDAKTINCSYFFKKGENGRNYLFYNIKPGFCQRNNHGKSMIFPFKIDARKRYVKSMENDAKRAPELNQNRSLKRHFRNKGCQGLKK